MIKKLFANEILVPVDWKVVLAIIVSTLSVVVERYQSPFLNENLDHLLFFGIIPLCMLLIMRLRLKDYGVRMGDFKFGIFFTMVACLFMTLIMLVVAPFPDFQIYYGSSGSSFWELVSSLGIDLIGWEFLFRGFLMFSLWPVCGPYAIFLQAVPFTIAHIGKPEIETYSCIFGGAILGWLAWRTRSFIYPFIIHWYLAVITVLFSRGF